MGSPNASTWDASPSHRPTTADFNGAAKIDDAVYPPDPTTMPSAAEWNTICKTLASIGQVIPNVSIDFTGTGGGGTFNAARSPLSGVAVLSGTTISVPTGVITITRNGAGDYSFTWPANTFPTPLGTPRAIPCGNGAANWTADAVAITNGVRVKTALAGTLTDGSATVDVF